MQTIKIENNLRKIARTTPIPLAGLLLGLSSTGNLVPEFRWFFGFFAFAILAVLVLKFIVDRENLREDFKNPAIAGIACTMTMGTSVLSTYLKPYSLEAALGMWIVSMVVHLGFMAYFTKSYILRFDVRKCLPCYFVVYVGFAVNAFIAIVYGYQDFGQALFWFGLASLLILLPPLLYRAVVLKGLPENLIPTLMIFAAPTNVCLYGYLRTFNSPDPSVVWALLILATVLYIGCMAILPRILMLKKFYPAYSSLTFPLAISGTASMAAYKFFKASGDEIPLLETMALFQVSMAVVFVLYVLFRYMFHFLWKPFVVSRAKDAVQEP